MNGAKKVDLPVTRYFAALPWLFPMGLLMIVVESFFLAFILYVLTLFVYVITTSIAYRASIHYLGYLDRSRFVWQVFWRHSCLGLLIVLGFLLWLELN